MPQATSEIDPAIIAHYENAVATNYIVRALAYASGMPSARSTGSTPMSRAGRSLARKHLGVTVVGDESMEVLFEACELHDRRYAVTVLDMPELPLVKLATELGRVLALGRGDFVVAQMGIFMSLHPGIAEALDCMGEKEIDDLVKMLAYVLETDEELISNSITSVNALREFNPDFMEYHEVQPPSRLVKLVRYVARKVYRGVLDVEELLAGVFSVAPPARVGLDEFDDVPETVTMVRRYLDRVASTGRKGANILLHGKPGTGKTQFVRAMAKSLEFTLFEVPTVDEGQDPLPAVRRIAALGATQRALVSRPRTMVVFDEVEEVFDGTALSFDSERPRRQRNGRVSSQKGWLNRVLEEGARPTFWISNDISGMDPAYLRRFDLIIELATPRASSRARVVEDYMKGLPVSGPQRERLVADKNLAPGHVERISEVVRLLEPLNEFEGDGLVSRLHQQTLSAMRVRKAASAKALLPYRAECVNTNHPLNEVHTALKQVPEARMCLYGPPGTGKTEWARQLAVSLDRPLMVRRGSDLLSKFVGETEQLIREAFEEAEHSGAVLLIDEADGLLHSRAAASHSFEVSMINEVLTSMETFNGIFVASTNMVGQLDEASARRFDLKVEFSCLRADQAELLLVDLMAFAKVGDCIDVLARARLNKLQGLTPGDFHAVARQQRLRASTPSVGDLDLPADFRTD